MQDPLQPTHVQPGSSAAEDDVVMVDVDDLISSDDDSFGSDFDTLTEADELPENPEGSKPPSYSMIAKAPMSTEIAPPPPSSAVPQKTSRPMSTDLQPPPYPRQGSMCMICKVKPVYRDNRGVFPTCGITCAQKLEAASIPQSVIMQGHMNNPRNSYDLRSGSSNHTNGDWQVHSARTGQIRMCEVCHVRPKCQRGGKIYPTCGLTCAAKLHPTGTVEMCDYCKKRPKVILNGRKFLHCGRTCRDNAKMAAAAAGSATCTTCLACWKADRSRESDFCSPLCKMSVEGRAPVLIELPRGHASFKKVAEAFADSWTKSRVSASVPTMKSVYMVYTSATSRRKQEQYKNRVSQSSLFQRISSSQIGWLGTPRECGFGDAGNVEPCSSTKCLLCSVVRSSVSREHFSEGIPTTTLLPRAVEIASNVRRRTSKVVMLASIAFGTVVEKSDLSTGPLPPPGYDSVHLVSYSNFGVKLDYGETFVFDVAAIRPKYLISFE